MSGKTGQPSLGVLLLILVLLLGGAIALLVTQHSREQVIAAYVLFALVVAIVTFGILRSTGAIKRNGVHLGGAIAGFVVVLWILVKLPVGEGADVVGDLYIDGIPPGTAKVCILETDLRDNCRDLAAGDKGHFAFHGVRGLRGNVHLEVTLSAQLLPKVVERPFRNGTALRIELQASDFSIRTASETLDMTSPALKACRLQGATKPEVLYLFDLASTNLDPEKCNTFLNVLAFKLDRGIRAHLESYRLLEDTPLDLRRCSEVRVRQDTDAVAAGRALEAPGVLWGFAEESGGQVRSILSFTTLAGKPSTVFTGLRASSDLTALVQVDEPVDNLYLALSSYLLGVRYIEEGRTALARRCFIHAKELNVLTGETASEVERLLHSLEGPGAATDLAPIGEG